jgi:phospholipid transport system transporter-binding protein
MHQPGSALTITHARAELEAGLAAIARGETVVDLAAVTEVDSSAVASLLAWQRAARQQGRALRLVNLPASVQSLARLYGVDGLIGTQEPAAAR